MKKEIMIESNSTSVQELKRIFDNLKIQEPELEIKELDNDMRGVSPEVLTAIISASSSVMGIIITEMIKYFISRKSGKIKIESENGVLEVPKDISDAKMKSLIQHMNSLDKPKIILP